MDPLNSLFSVPKSLFSNPTMLVMDVNRACITCEPHLHCLRAALALLMSHACIASRQSVYLFFISPFRFSDG